MDGEGFVLLAPSKGSLSKASARNTLHPGVAREQDDAEASVPSRTAGRGFVDLGLDGWLMSVLSGLSIRVPAPVQAACIPPLLQQRDVIASAKTGSGKTLAFALPILHHLSRAPHGLFAVILTPTRELAMQIVEQFQVFGREVSLRVCLASIDMMKQSIELDRKPHIIVATPGRLLDLLSSCNVGMPRLQYLVFDEADRLCDPASTFMVDEVPQIVSRIVAPATTLGFFSATMTSSVASFYRGHRPEKTPFVHNGNPTVTVPDSLCQLFMLVPSQVREAYLVSVLQRPPLAGRNGIVFVGKCKTCELVAGILRELKLPAISMHGRMTQRDRQSSLQRFRAGKALILVTTDVASRGLDIPLVGFVLNLDLPSDPRDYVHRVGRAARAGRSGSAISFVHELDVDLFDSINSSMAGRIAAADFVPSEHDIAAVLNSVSVAKRKVSMRLHDARFGERQQINSKKQTRLS